MRPEDQNHIQIRPPKPSDLNFIQSTFLKSMKRESSLGRSCSVRVFFKEFPQVIDHILARSKCILACYKHEPDAILGYLIFEPDIIHYAYVRDTCRGYELAKELLKTAMPDAKSVSFTFNTNTAKMINKKHPELIHNPFLLFKKEITHE